MLAAALLAAAAAGAADYEYAVVGPGYCRAAGGAAPASWTTWSVVSSEACEAACTAAGGACIGVAVFKPQCTLVLGEGVDAADPRLPAGWVYQPSVEGGGAIAGSSGDRGPVCKRRENAVRAEEATAAVLSDPMVLAPVLLASTVAVVAAAVAAVASREDLCHHAGLIGAHCATEGARDARAVLAEERLRAPVDPWKVPEVAAVYRLISWKQLA
eukprot:TRINITY_DN5806_c1_g2_i1.p1 TRINITY_DN5806_c1_g2~~TRINITY_DN5806_c1_g2_i1.p1  ORF type:complete len:214 (+),score=43.81 TRINITY_DN5806_c1_g2_i1:996-1637(+)